MQIGTAERCGECQGHHKLNGCLPGVLTHGTVRGSMRPESIGMQESRDGMRSEEIMKEPNTYKFEVDLVQDAKNTEPDNDEEKRTE